MNVEGFDSLDDIMRRLREDMAAADARVQPWQAAITTGDYFQRAAYGVRIYGEVLDNPDPREPTLQHYRFCRCYSMMCPTGELGDVHVSTIERVLKPNEFEAAKQRTWRNE